MRTRKSIALLIGCLASSAVALAGDGFIQSFVLLGPFPAPLFDEALAGNPLDQAITEDGLLRPDLPSLRAYEWRPVKAVGGKVNLAEVYGARADVVAYAFAWIASPRDLDLNLLAGSDDGIAIWLNAERLHVNTTRRGLRIDDDLVPVRLRSGWNRLLIKVSQAGAGWGFCVRLTTPSGIPVDLPVRTERPLRDGERIELPIVAEPDRLALLDHAYGAVAARTRLYRELAERSCASVDVDPPELALVNAVDAGIDAMRRATSAARIQVVREAILTAVENLRRSGLFAADQNEGDVVASEALDDLLVGLRGDEATYISPGSTLDTAWVTVDALMRLLAQLETLAALAVSELIERPILERAEQAIEVVRKSEATLRVVDANGSPVAGATVEVRQVTSDFRFGSNIFLFQRLDPVRNAAYEERFAELFNYATTDFYWEWYEPVRGKPNYSYTDRVAAWCADHGIRLKGHPLLWQRTNGLPSWGVPTADEEAARVRNLVGRYRGRIQSWDVVNESVHVQHGVAEPYRAARSTAAEAELVVNEFGILNDGFPPFYARLQAMLANGDPFDAIGIQAHEPLNLRFPLAAVDCWLDRYATLGKPIHITELTPPSAGQPMLGSHLQGTWNEAIQADYVAKLYTILFAHPAVAAITWWDLSDRKSWQRGGGLLSEEMGEKPAYRALRHLILQRWRTSASGRTEANGEWHFRGFHGNYDVAVAGQTFSITLRRGGLNSFPLSVDGSAPPQ